MDTIHITPTGTLQHAIEDIYNTPQHLSTINPDYRDAALFTSTRHEFVCYIAEVGLRYAVQWAKCKDVSLGVIQYWASQYNASIQELDVQKYYVQDNLNVIPLPTDTMD